MIWLIVGFLLFVSSAANAAVTRFASPTGAGFAPCTVNHATTGACPVSRALLVMAPGDTLILKNGRYTGASGMLLGPAGIAGTSNAARITVQAENDGQVLIDGTNNNRPITLGSGRNYWTIKGINVCCSYDTTIMIGSGNNNNRLERVIAWDQEDPTAGVITIYQTQNTTLVDVAAFGHGRKMFAVQSDTNTVVNRGFFFKFKTKPAPNNGGVTTTYTYHSRGNKFYNTINGTDLVAPTANPYYQNAIFSNDHYQDDHGIMTTIEMHGNITYHVDGQRIDTMNVLATYGMNPAASTIPADNEITFKSRNNLTMRRNGAFPPLGHNCSANGTSVKCDRDNWTDSLGSLATGTHDTESGTPIPASPAPDLLRLAATTQPASGAWIRYKYTDAGVLTTEELWPWPMRDRLIAAISGTEYATRGWDGKGNKDINAIILALAGSSLGATEVLHLTYTQQPMNTLLGVTLSSVKACVYNADNVTQLGFATPITIALQSNPGSATLGGTLTQTPVSGCATWNNLTVSAAGAGYTLRATSAGVTQADSNTFDITTVPITVVGERVRVIP